MSSLSDAERDACDVVQALAGLAVLLARSADRGPEWDDVHRTLLRLAEDGSAAAARVLAYLRELRGPGDGAAAAVPPQLAPWRDWTPPRGHLFRASSDRTSRVDHLDERRRADPGE